MNLELNKIYQGDCLEIMKTMPNEYIDCVITSPPYDGLRDYKGYSFNFEGIASELKRILKVGGVIVWVVGDQTVNGSESGTSFKQALFFKEIGLNLHDTMIYEKNGSPYPETNRYYQSFEYMFVFSKGKPKTANLLNDRKNRWAGSWGKQSTREKDGTLTRREKSSSDEMGVRFNIWRINSGYGRSTKDEIAYQHPATFPESLPADHIKTWTNEGDVVLDPMNGSGTTTKIAQYLGRNFIGIDISKEYCEIANKRLSQKNLFTVAS
jgi:DNA modification methylase